MSLYPGGELSNDALDVLKPIIEDSMDRPLIYQKQVISFVLYLIREKPATEFSETFKARDLDEETLPTPTRMLPQGMIDLNVPHETVLEQINSSLSTIHYEAIESSDVELPPCQLESEDEFHRRWGNHYGYPKSAISGYINDNVLRCHDSEHQYSRFIQLARVTGFTREAARRIGLISFIPADSPEGVKDSIERAIEYEEALRETAKQSEAPEIEKLVDKVIENTPFSDKFIK